MRRPSPLSMQYLTLGGILFNVLSTTNATSISKSSIIEATKQKHNILINDNDKVNTNDDHDLRQLQSTDNPPLTTEQFDQCKSDLLLADIDSNGQLDKYEYLRFLSLNSAHYDYAWGFASNQILLGDLPLEFPMLFHSTACMCAYEQLSGVDFGCCEGDNGHVIVYVEKDEEGNIFSDGMTEEEEAYTRLFCTEAYYSYSSTFMPTRSPIVPVVTLPPTEAVVTTSPTGSPTNGQVGTMPPTLFEPVSLPTASPVGAGEGGTNSPTLSPDTMPPITPSPVATGVTSSPTNSPISTDTTSSPTSSPITTTTTSSPTISPSSSPTATQIDPPTQSPISSILSIDIQYGISSNCGMTAEDVLNNNYGITIQDGLISATEAVVVDVLNTTFPRTEEETETIPTVISEESDGSGGLNTEPTLSPTGGMTSVPEEGLVIEGPSDPPTTMANDPFLPPSPTSNVPSRLEDEEMKEESEENDPFMPPSLKGARFRVFGPLHKSNRRNLVQLNVPSSPQHKHTTSNHHQDSRSLVYYTQLNPIVITDIEDVLDQACPEGINCMRVVSTIYVTLEEGDDPVEVEQVILDGFQSSLQDASFFQAIPADTIFCPLEPTTSPISIPVTTGSPTMSSSLPAVETSSPTLSPVSVPTSLSPTTASPVMSGVTDSPTLSPVGSVTEPPVIEGSTSSPTGTTVPTNVSGGSSLSPTLTNKPTPAGGGTSSPISGGDTASPTSSPITGGTLSPSTSSNETNSPTISRSPIVGGTGTLSPVTSGETTSPSIGGTTSSPIAGIPVSPTSSPAVSTMPVYVWPTYSPTPSSLTWGPTITAYPTPSLTWPPTTATPDGGGSSGTTVPTVVSGSSVSPTSLSSSVSSSQGTTTPLQVSITYDLANDCGLDAEAIMSGTENTLLEGLIAATTTTTIGILNETFPRVEEEVGDGPTRNRNVRRRLARLKMGNEASVPVSQPLLSSSSHIDSQRQQRRNLVFYTDEFPVVIDRILDIEQGCAPGSNCLLVISSITAILEPGDDSAAVNDAIVSGMQDSFADGSFFAAIPADTIICP